MLKIFEDGTWLIPNANETQGASDWKTNTFKDLNSNENLSLVELDQQIN